jgi:hypothetical protein
MHGSLNAMGYFGFLNIKTQEQGYYACNRQHTNDKGFRELNIDT